MKSRSENLEAIVLRVTPYGESDAIVSLLTSGSGRISAFASGARRSAKRFGGALDLFSKVRAEIRRPRGVESALWRLERLDLLDLHLSLRCLLDRYATAAYLSECLCALTGEGHADRRLFDWWAATLEEMSAPSFPADRMAYLELELLCLLGHGPRWSPCGECGNVPGGDRIFFSFERGGVMCDGCRRPGEGGIRPDDRNGVGFQLKGFDDCRLHRRAPKCEREGLVERYRLIIGEATGWSACKSQI